MEKVILRFAPSPTGFLHIGGARTALFNWLMARNQGGKFILRIEDTDQVRSTRESIDAILDSMIWLGLDWDEGPIYQTDRLPIYREHVDRLLQEGKAYPCYCTPEELEEKRQRALKEKRKPKYDGSCRELSGPVPGRTPAVRFKAPHHGKTVLYDLIKGTIEFDNEELDDLIILRSDGWPTYNFSAMVDDATMGITHVIRGDDHVNNTPRQILLYQAFGYPLPRFAHVPMILGADKARLSKRHGATSVMAYKEMGYLPQALDNYLVRLGWSYGDQEVFTKEDLIQKFSLENVGKSAAVFNGEKLLWLNGLYLRQEKPETLAELLLPFLEARGLKPRSMNWLAEVTKTLKERAKTLVEMADQAEFYLRDDFQTDEKAQKKHLTPNVKESLEALASRLEANPEMDEKGLEEAFKSIAEAKGLKLGAIAQAVRVALTGKSVSPGIYEVTRILGKDEVLKRLNRAMKKL
ncbi:MAG TPA: glutamate--tRNA ligase [Thermodesulfobacteriota bacterium]|nr:glutamate--tRNA ligase [Thermodesulfobacteriota bacterium]